MKATKYIKYCVTLLLLLLLGTYPKQVKADLIWTPSDDFFHKHYHDCEHIGRKYIANGKKGYITLYKNPLLHKKVDSYINGTVFYVSHAYKDKKNTEWGVIDVNYGALEKKPFTGWVPMDQLVLVYDEISFTADHKDEFKTYNGEFDKTLINDNSRVVLWTYPGSGEILSILPTKSKMEFDTTYTDKDGRVWGIWWRGWVCISDPMNKNIPSSGVKTSATLYPPDQDALKNAGKTERFVMLFLLLLTASLTAVTAIIIKLFWGKNKEK